MTTRLLPSQGATLPSRKSEQPAPGARHLLLAALLAALTAVLLPATAAAQDEPEYKMEVGAGLGLATYQGDFNGAIIHSPQPMAGVTARYKMNPRMGWQLNLAYGKLKGSSEDADTWYPTLSSQPVRFATSVVDAQLRYEYNFWPFGTGREYLGAKPFTPFIALGAGLSFVSPKATEGALQQEGSTAALQLPIGMGVKMKLMPRLNLTAEWMVHFTGTDRIDGTPDPYGIKSDGLFKNTDGYSTLMLSLTFEFWERCKTCNNDE